MTLADAFLVFRKTRAAKPDFTHLSAEMIDLCHFLEPILANKIDKLPTVHAEGFEPRITARPTGKRKKIT